MLENLGKNTLGKVNSKHKGPEAGPSSAGLRNSKKTVCLELRDPGGE